jgi:hypothetical protein
MDNNMMLGPNDALNQLRPYELKSRLELQSSGSCFNIVWTDCGCCFVGCCPYAAITQCN